MDTFTPQKLVSKPIGCYHEHAQYIFQECIESRDLPELNYIPLRYHPMAPIIVHMSMHGVPIVITCGIKEEDLGKVISYGGHDYSQNISSFVWGGLSEKL